jgi:hypothetical protein
MTADDFTKKYFGLTVEETLAFWKRVKPAHYCDCATCLLRRHDEEKRRQKHIAAVKP